MGQHLEFHKHIFNTCLEEDGLVVIASGLGIEQVILAFLKYYSDSSKLVFFIDAQSNESLETSYLQYTEQLLSFGLRYGNLPTLINQEHSGASKLNLYMKGGVFFGASSIFVLDFLMKRIPHHLVSGIIIVNAHRVTDTSTESLLIRLYRQTNKTGFIKAFTSDAPALGGEINKTQRLMKLLHVSRLLLFPRFHTQITSVLDQHPPDLVELSVEMTPSMKNIEKSLTATINACIQRLKSKNNLQHIEDDFIYSFDSVLQQQFKPIWANLTTYSKQLISDIKLLKSLSLQTNEEEPQSWIHSDESEQLFTHCRERIFKFKRKIVKNSSRNQKQKKKKLKKSNKNKDDDDEEIIDLEDDEEEDEDEEDDENNNNKKKKNDKEEFERVLVLEENPKWNLLYQVLQEIEIENESSETPGTVIIFVKDERTVQQLQNYLNLGGKDYLYSRYEKFVATQQFYQQQRQQQQEESKQDSTTSTTTTTNKTNNSNFGGNGKPYFRYSNRQNQRTNRKQKITETNKKKKTDHGNNTLFEMGVSVIGNSVGSSAISNLMIPAPRIIDIPILGTDNNGTGAGQLAIDGGEHISTFNEFYQMLPPPYIIIHPMEASHSILNEVRPKFIIIYDPDVAITRHIEVYKALNSGTPLRVYFMFFNDSAEDKRYLAILNRERNSFEKLIREKMNLVIDTNQEGKNDLPEDKSHLELLETPISKSMRFGGKKILPSKTRRVIIDSFEFKSSLPVVLHANGFEIVPLRLAIGDYVLSPKICIERKSISDLIGSFASGRLYAQIEAMNRAYHNPILLIEFDQYQPFCFVPFEELKQSFLSLKSLSSKLVLLTKSFPRLRILWSRHSYSSVNLYDRLKLEQPEPEPETVNVVPETDQEYNFSSQDVLRMLPGVNQDNIKSIMDNVEDLHQLSSMSVQELKDILKSDLNANLLYDFFQS
eukprot:gene4610-5759_t